MNKDYVIKRIERELESLEIIYNCKITNVIAINNIIESCLAINNIICSNIVDKDDYFICVGDKKQLFEDNLYYHFRLRCFFNGCNLEFSLLGFKNENLSK